MRAKEETVLTVIGGLDKVFIIPPFQRNYEWTEIQCEELFRDIEKSYKSGKSHYLGNVVYYVGQNSGASYNENILIDGQQRITTILLLLCAIRDYVDEDSIKDSINKRYLKNDTSDNRYRVRLKQTSYDDDGFIAIVDNLPVKKKDSNVYQNYTFFLKLLKESAIPSMKATRITGLICSASSDTVSAIFSKWNSIQTTIASAIFCTLSETVT